MILFLLSQPHWVLKCRLNKTVKIMKVISKVNNRRLVKGGEYTIDRILNDKCKIRGISWYKTSNFKTIDGGEINLTSWMSVDSEIVSYEDTNLYNLQNIKSLQKGDLIFCRKKKSVYLKVGCVYEIEDILIKEKELAIQSVFHQGRPPRKFFIKKVKIKGHNRWMSFDSFRKLTEQEKRDISLKKIFNEDTGITRKLNKEIISDYSGDVKTSTIFKLLSKSIVDQNRNNLSIIDWTIQKTGKELRITKEDIDQILNMKLSTLLSKIN